MRAGRDVGLPKGMVDSAPALNALRMEVRGARNYMDPGGFLYKNNVRNGELKQGGESGVVLSDIDGVDDEVVNHWEGSTK